ncbi:MAG: DUF2062 domain-containing protein [Xanthomonadaceae bacterium]|nr:DUF2062 domain-containing protein [Xanthomonadaceae bacterium]
MPKKFLKRLLPDTDSMRRHKHLRHFGELLRNHSLWHLNRRSVSGGVAAGLFVAMLPLPFQMLIAAGIAILGCVNLPIAVAMVWVTNPLTMGPIYYFNYRAGALLLGKQPTDDHFRATVTDLIGSMLHIWKPLLLGGVVVGLLLAVLGWILVRMLWRWHVVSRRWPKQ